MGLTGGGPAVESPAGPGYSIAVRPAIPPEAPLMKTYLDQAIELERRLEQIKESL